MEQQWQIQRTGGVCSGTGRQLEIGEEYYAALVETETGFERRDFSISYWESQKPEVYSFWKTVIPQPNQKKKLFVDDGVLINFFERLAEEKEELKVNFRFVIALILMRKKLLKYEDSRVEGDGEIWKMRFVRESRTHEVVNPHLDDEQIGQVSSELSSILQGELE